MCTRAPWILLGLTMLTAAVYVAGGAPAVVLHPLLGLLSHGTSAGKIYFLLGFMAAFSLIWGCMTRRKQSGSPVGPGIAPVAILLTAATVGLIAGMASYASYTGSLGLSWRETTLHWEHGFNSSNSLTHMHTTKAALALGVELCGWTGLHAKFDTGVAYLSSVPRIICVTLGVSFLAACIAALLVGPRVAAEAGARGDWTSGVVLALALGSITKCMLDGGPLSYDCVAGLVAATCIIQGGSARWAWLGRRWPWFAITISLWVATIGLLSPDSVEPQFFQLTRRLCLYGVIIAAGSITLPGGVAGWRRIAVTSGAVLICVQSLYTAVTGRVVPLFEPVPGRVVSHAPGAVPDSSNVRVSALNAYAHHHEQPHRVLWTSLLAGTSSVATGFFADVHIIGGGQLRPSTSPDGIVIVSTGSTALGEAAGRTHVKVTFAGTDAPVLYRDAPNSQLDDNEKFVAYRLLDRHLRSLGVDRYVLIPYDSFRERGGGAAVVTTHTSSVCQCCEIESNRWLRARRTPL